jgi:serine/threonine protein kinase
MAQVRIESLFCMVVKEAPGTEGEGSEVWRMSRSNFKFGLGLGFINSLAAAKAAELIATPLEQLKLTVERLLKEYKPPEHVVEELELTWKGGLWRMALEAALGVQYLHHHRYWSDGGKRHNGATNEVEEEEAGWKESVIHRDLKPDNMLLTRDWTLKLTDFGEARAQNMGGTMTSVGTPIYIAPEVMRGDKYDVTADTWSYGLCLVAMIRAERTLEQFFYQVSLPARRFTNDHF